MSLCPLPFNVYIYIGEVYIPRQDQTEGMAVCTMTTLIVSSWQRGQEAFK